ncbi:MAG: pyridoxal phosphate-dependent aminotransferase [Desulfarculus sp.]|nr:pyridoxal phosphate-dependent aminotransferase [Desulfarculus sp.]
MELARRVMSIQPSPTLAVDAKAKALKAAGVDVISFGVGEPDFRTPAHICQAAKEAIDQGFHGYTAADGMPELKKAVAEKFKRDNGLDYTTDQVIINVGGKHSSYLLMQALLNEGDEVIVPAPYWVSYPPMVILAGGVPVIVPTSEADDFKLNLADLTKAITKKTKAIFINSPSNPTGSVYSAQELLPLAQLCADNGIIIVSDEMYEPILFGGRKFVSTASLGDKIFQHTCTLNGVSKAYAMTGWRIGYMAGPQPLIKACAKIQSQSTSNPTSISQKAALTALTGPQDEVEKMRVEFEKRLAYILGRLRAMPGVTCSEPGGAFYVFPNLSAYFGKKFGDKVIKGSLELSDYLLEQAHIATVPGVAFGEDSCVRFSFATSMELIAKGMDRLADGLAKLK